jgi:hypothetical protein
MRALFYANDTAMSAVSQRRIAHKEIDSSDESLKHSGASTDRCRHCSTTIDDKVKTMMMSSTV